VVSFWAVAGMIKERFGESTQIMQTLDDQLKKITVINKKNMEQLRTLAGHNIKSGFCVRIIGERS
jgi:hypothetical protein